MNERWQKQHWHSVGSKGSCNGFASYYGPCGDPACGNCFPGGQYACDKCERDTGECECLSCEYCGEEFDHDEWEVCIDCYCEDCGELKTAVMSELIKPIQPKEHCTCHGK